MVSRKIKGGIIEGNHTLFAWHARVDAKSKRIRRSDTEVEQKLFRLAMNVAKVYLVESVDEVFSDVEMPLGKPRVCQIMHANCCFMLKKLSSCYPNTFVED